MNTNISEISCPACKMSNEAGAIRCAYCHTPLKHNEQKTVTIKKVQESTGTLPEFFDDYLSVDLTDFGAIDNGISRVHALIRKTPRGYQITDLESTNGTWHENQRLIPRKPHSLESGDRIRLGRLNILVFYLS